MNDDVRHRKLTPIYNALDSGNYKGAIKLCQKKDIEKWDITQALHAYALICMHRNQEALEMARAVKDKKPTDENTLSALTLTFKTARAEEDAAECFENALLVNPTHEDYLQELVCCYLRLGDYKRMQLTAQKMYKTTMKSKYMYWVVTSMLLQPSLPPAMLDVAERMITKILAEQPEAPGADEVMLLGELYRRQLLLLPAKSDKADEKLLAAFSYIDSIISLPASQPIDDDAFYAQQNASIIKSYSSNILFMKLDLLMEFASPESSLASAVIADILSAYPDHWEALKALVERCFHPNIADLSIHNSAVAACRDHLRSLQMGSPKLRGPYLAEIYLLRVQTEKQSSNDLLDEIASLILAYMDRFDDKQCCFTDIKPLLRYLALTLPSSEQKTKALTAFMQSIDNRCTKLSADVQQCSSEDNSLTVGLYKLCNAFDVKFFLDAVWRSDKPAIAPLLPVQSHLLEVYAATKTSKSGIGGDREVYPGDELIWLVAKYIQQSISTEEYNEAKSLSSLSVWTALLLQGKLASPYNYVFATELLEPLRRLGCSQFTLDMFNSLEVKNVQVDSLSYLLIPTMFETACFPEIRQQYRIIMRFHDTGLRDTREMMSRSMKNANYAKSVELDEFARVCERSTQLALAKAEYPLLEVLERFDTPQMVVAYLQDYIAGTLPESMSVMSEQDLAQLHDNMDYDLLIRLEDHEAFTDRTPASIRHEQYIYRIRRSQLLVRTMLHVLQNDTSAATTRLSELTDLLGSEKASNIVWKQCIDSSDEMVKSLVWATLTSLCEFTVAITSSASTEGSLNKYTSHLTMLQEVLCLVDASQRHIFKIEGFSLLRPSWIKSCSYAIWTLACWIPLLLMHTSLTKKFKDQKKSKKSKKTTAEVANPEYETFKVIVEATKSFFESWHAAVAAEIKDESFRPSEDLLANVVSRYIPDFSAVLKDDMIMELNGNLKAVVKNIFVSQQLSCTRMDALLRAKITSLGAVA